MTSSAKLLSLTMLVLLNAPHTAFGQPAWGYVWCTDGSGRYDFCYRDARQSCHVTMSGLGVCVPRPPVSSGQRR
jgi:hypothetical protein